MNSKSIIVLGGGESGTGAAVLAKKKGMRIFVSDKGKIDQKYKNVLSHFDIQFEEGKHSEDLILKADEIIKSPGIPDDIAIIKSMKQRGIKIISEIEFAARYTDAYKICITGSNGKTTTTLLTYHILKNAGLNVGLAGNVGESFAMSVATMDFDYYVLEISSFQLDGMFDFKAETAILMNITPDHLDRYDNNFLRYADSKLRIIQNQTSDDAFIYCMDDEVITNELKNRKRLAKSYPFSTRDQINNEGAFLKYPYDTETPLLKTEKNEIIINIKQNPINMTIENLALQGRHNVYNSMAAGIAARILEIRKDDIKESLSDFQNIEHRLEFVATIHGIDFINDSKATNVNSSWYALESINKPIIWIVGGIDKGNDYSILTDLVKTKVKSIVCLGIDNTKIHKAFGDLVEDIVDTFSAKDAVLASYHLGKQGDTVLLSPTCASFDLFTDYEDRGNSFKKAINEL